MPSGCTAGRLHCGCHHDGTCDAPAGVPLTCIENICVETKAREVGTLGAACEDDRGCDEELRCVSGQCEQAGCPSGKLACPCGPYGFCEPYAGTELRCSQEGTCGVGACEAGSAGCACRDGSGSCDGELSCSDGRCVRPRFTLRVGSSAVRACDVAFEAASGAPITEVRFSGSVRGQQHARAPQVGVSFLHEEALPFAGPPLWVETASATGDKPAIVRQRCFDASGAEVEEAELELVGSKS